MNEEIQYIDPGMNLAPPMALPPSDKADLLEKIKPSMIVEEIRHKLMGEEWVNGAWMKVKALQNRALTMQGAADISNLMLAVSSQNVSISKLRDEDIRARTMSIIKTAQRMCLRNWKEYGIKGVDQLWFVHEIVMSNTFITLKQPEGEGIRKMLMGTIAEQHVKSQPEKKRWSLFGNKQ